MRSRRSSYLFVSSLAALVCWSSTASATYVDEVLADNPIAYWRFEESIGSGGSLDSSVNSHSGAIGSGVTLGQPSVNGSLGNAASFNGGANGKIDYGDGFANFSSDDSYTLEAWINSNDLFGLHEIVSRHNDEAGTVNWELRTDGPSAEFALDLAFNFSTAATAQSVSFNTGQWYHVVGVGTGSATGTNMQIYVNGLVDGTGGFPTGPQSGDPDANVLVGAIEWTANRKFSGLIDEVAIYNTALSPERIKAHYDAVVPEPSALVLATLALLSFGVTRRRRRRS